MISSDSHVISSDREELVGVDISVVVVEVVVVVVVVVVVEVVVEVAVEVVASVDLVEVVVVEV